MNSVKKSGYISELDTLKKRLNDKTFRLAVVGEFSSGKSTFINAIIGKDVLKHAATETTATVTYIYNVLKDDERINTCVIERTDGTKMSLPDLDKLKDYTTVNSEINVAESIRSVSIYVNFLNVKYPIMIADTPGLNGIADKHREITLDEIKKAHACIYLLSSNGVKSTDFDFINILLNYQKKFIFIQNFIDLLRTSEGETLQSKISKDNENLKICFGKDTSDIDYSVYGISAVKALAAKDLDKTKVFEEDINEIDDRNQLYAESNFTVFEECLYEIIESGEYLEVIEEAATYTLRQMIEKLKNNLDEECELSEQLRAKDDKTRRIEKAQKMIERINLQKEDQQKRLKNFLVSRDSENRHSLHEYARRCLEELFEFIKGDLDKKAKTYEEFVTFADYYEYEPTQYYGKYISDYINGKLIPDLDGRMQDNLSHLYEEAILKVSNFITSVSTIKENINIEIENKITEFNEKEIKSEFEKYEVELELKRSRIKTIESKIREGNAKKNDVENDIKNEKQSADSDRQKYEREKQRIGNDPGVKKNRVQKTRTVSRTGLFAGFRNWLFGEKTETYWVEVDDYSEQNEWKKRKAALEEKNRRTQDKHNERMIRFESDKKKIQDQINVNSSAIARLQGDILEIETRAKREKEIYERTLKANKQEYCDNEKRKLKEEIYRVIIEKKEGDSVLDKMYKHIDDMDLRNLPIIQEKVLNYYADSVKARIDSLNDFIQKNETELELKYELSKKEITILNEVLAKI